VVTSAPGRVNLIGGHTDYNGGPVLPVAVERRTVVAAGPWDDWRFVSSVDGEVHEVDPDAPLRRDWTDCLVGTVRKGRQRGVAPAGAQVAVATSVPIGAGLSSSAALTVAAARGLGLLAGRSLPPADLVEVAWHAEHDQVACHPQPLDRADRRPPFDRPEGHGSGAAALQAVLHDEHGAHRCQLEPRLEAMRP